MNLFDKLTIKTGKFSEKMEDNYNTITSILRDQPKITTHLLRYYVLKLFKKKMFSFLFRICSQ